MRFGMPQPRFTYAPSGNSRAARSAICSRESLFLIATAFSYFHDSIHKYRRCDDGFRIKRAHRDNFLHLDDRDFRGGRHHWIEIARGLPVREISERVRAVRANESVVGEQRGFKNAPPTIDDALLLAVRNFRSDAYGGVKGGNSGTGSAHPLA